MKKVYKENVFTITKEKVFRSIVPKRVFLVVLILTTIIFLFTLVNNDLQIEKYTTNIILGLIVSKFLIILIELILVYFTFFLFFLFLESIKKKKKVAIYIFIIFAICYTLYMINQFIKFILIFYNDSLSIGKAEFVNIVIQVLAIVAVVIIPLVTTKMSLKKRDEEINRSIKISYRPHLVLYEKLEGSMEKPVLLDKIYIDKEDDLDNTEYLNHTIYFENIGNGHLMQLRLSVIDNLIYSYKKSEEGKSDDDYILFFEVPLKVNTIYRLDICYSVKFNILPNINFYYTDLLEKAHYKQSILSYENDPIYFSYQIEVSSNDFEVAGYN